MLIIFVFLKIGNYAFTKVKVWNALDDGTPLYLKMTQYTKSK